LNADKTEESDEYSFIRKQDYSNRVLSRMTGLDKRTVDKYLKEGTRYCVPSFIPYFFIIYPYPKKILLLLNSTSLPLFFL